MFGFMSENANHQTVEGGNQKRSNEKVNAEYTLAVRQGQVLDFGRMYSGKYFTYLFLSYIN